MAFLRSLLFQSAFYISTIVIGFVCLPAILLGPRASQRVGRMWGSWTMMLLRFFCGLDYRIRGSVPDEPVVLAVKHQSAWETLALPVVLGRPAFVMKRELLWVPVVGQYLWASRQIAIDRSKGTAALRDTVKGARRELDDGRPVVIFPEGTRVAPGQRGTYQPGIAALYSQLDVPVVPVAVNSGYFWRRREFSKRPGTVTEEVR